MALASIIEPQKNDYVDENGSEIKNIYVHWWFGHIHFLSSSALTLNVPATIKIPMLLGN